MFVLSKNVTVKDPATGAKIEGSVTKVTTENGEVKVEVNGKEYSTDDVIGVNDISTPKSENPPTTRQIGDKSKNLRQLTQDEINNLKSSDPSIRQMPDGTVIKTDKEVEKLLKLTMVNENDKTVPRFGCNEIAGLSEIYNNYPTEVESLSKITRADIGGNMDLYEGWIDKDEFTKSHKVKLLKLK